MLPDRPRTAQCASMRRARRPVGRILAAARRAAAAWALGAAAAWCPAGAQPGPASAAPPDALPGPALPAPVPWLSMPAAASTAPPAAAPSGSATATLPAGVQAALAAAGVPADALALWVQPVGEGRTSGPASAPLIAWQAGAAMNPASLMKLLPTFAALETLGPAWTWRTPVWFGGPVRRGVLEGPLVIRGTGDPWLVQERVLALLQRVRALGVQEIAGDIVLDRSAYALPERPPEAFDGEPTRPYNVAANALLLNQRSFILTFVPDAAARIARVAMEPALQGVAVPTSVPLADGECGAWRASLAADFSAPDRVVLAGRYPAACGERAWPVAYADPRSYDARLITELWQQLGGRLRGSVRDGTVPPTLATQPPTLEWPSVPLAEVVRDVNKFSNNPMAQLVFLALPGAAAGGRAGPVTEALAREQLASWVRARLGDDATAGLVVDNGSGLSRENRLTARALGRLLVEAWGSPVMPEFVASLPVAGADGTTRRLQALAGRAHLKTGSLRDVAGIAGYVHAPGGRRFAVVALINHPQANAARPVFEALLLQLLQSGARQASP